MQNTIHDHSFFFSLNLIRYFVRRRVGDKLLNLAATEPDWYYGVAQLADCDTP